MATATHREVHDDLLRDIGAFREEIAKLAGAILVTNAKLVASWYLLKVWRRTRKALREMDNTEAELCIKCKERCGFRLQTHLEKIAADMDEVIRHPIFSHLPRPVRQLYQSAKSDIENKLETYWIASDDEIHDLVTTVADKMKRRYAAGGM